MKLLFLLSFLLILSINAEQTSYENYSLIRFQLKGREQQRSFFKYFPEDSLDIWNEGFVSSPEEKDFDVLFSPKQQEYFLKLRLNNSLPNFHNVQILNKNIQSDIDAERKSMKEDEERKAKILKTLKTKEEQENFLYSQDEFFNNYRTLEQIYTFIDRIAQANPTMVEKKVIGKSVQGRDIFRYLIHAPGRLDPTKPAVYVQALQHAREWVTPPAGAFAYFKLVTTYNTNQRVKKLLDKMNVHYVPVVNPDGYVYAHQTNRMWRKNRRQNQGGSYGVDLNRNWKSGFGGSGSSGSPSSETYRGTAAYSEPETKTVADYLTAHQSTMKAAIDFHSYSQLMLRPWGKQSSDSPDEAKLRQLGLKMVDAIASVYRVRYENIKSSQLYLASGIVGDDFYETFKLDGYTIECRPGRFGGGGFAPPASQIILNAEENYQAVLTIMDHVYDNH